MPQLLSQTWSVSSDIIGGYIFKDSIKYYTLAQKAPQTRNYNEYQNLRKRAEKYLETYYSHLRGKYGVKKIAILFKVFIDPEGTIVNVEYADVLPEDVDQTEGKEMGEKVIKLFDKYPSYKPAKMKREEVSFLKYELFTF